METYLFRRTNARRSRCSSAASVGGPTEIPGRKIFTTAVSRNRTTTRIVDFICVEHSSPHGPASTDRTNRARLPSLFVPIGAKAHRNVEGRGSSQPTAPLNCHGRARVQSGYQQLLSSPQVCQSSTGQSLNQRSQPVRGSILRQLRQYSRFLPRVSLMESETEFPDENRCAHSRSS